MKRSLQYSVLLPALALLFLLGIGADYYVHHSYYLDAITNFSYPEFIATFVLLAGTYWVGGKNRHPLLQRLTTSGLGVTFWIWLLCVLILFSNNLRNKLDFPVDFSAFINVTTHVLGGMAALLFIGLSTFMTGKKILIYAWKWERFHPLVALGTGIMVITLVLFGLGYVNLLHQWLLLGLLAIPIVGFWRDSFNTVQKLLLKPFSLNCNLIGALSASILLHLLAINYINSIVPFPVGWDSLALYGNMASLIHDYQGLVSGNQAYNWSLFMSLGFTLFESPEVALGLSFIGGPLSLAALYALGKKSLTKDYLLLVMAFFYSLPFVSFQSFRDLKIDLGLLFVSLVVVMLALDYRKFTRNTSYPGWKILVLAGLMSGFAFGIKYTGIFLIFSFAAIIGYQHLGKKGLLSVVLLALFAMVALNLDTISGLGIALKGIDVLTYTLLVAGLGVLLYAGIKSTASLWKGLKHGALYLFLTVVAFAPWMIKNYAETGRLNQQALLYGKTDQPVLTPSQFKIKAFQYLMEKEGEVDIDLEALRKKYMRPSVREERTRDEVKSTIREEVQRFIGYEKGILKYLSIPYDATMNINTAGAFVDISFLFLGMLPLLFFVFFRGKSLPVYSAYAIFLVIWGLSVFSLVYDPAAVGDSLSDWKAGFYDEFGQSFPGWYDTYLWIAFAVAFPFVKGLAFTAPWAEYLVYPALFAMGLAALYQVVNHAERRKSPRTVTLLIFLLVFSFFWFLLAGAIPWYGYLIFALMTIMLIRAVQHPSVPKWLQAAGIGILLLVTLLQVSYRFTNYVPSDADAARQLINPAFAAYHSGSVTSARSLKIIQPAMADALDVLNENTDEKIYRVGTFIPYFIKKNDRRILSDNQLGIFENISDKLRNKKQATQAIYANDFRYIVVDLNTPSIDMTPEKSLTRKYETLIDFLKNNPDLTLLETDRIVANRDSVSGGWNEKQAMFGDSILYNGTIAVYKVQDE